MKVKLIYYLDILVMDKQGKEISNSIEYYFKSKEYGKSIQELYIGISVLRAKFRSFETPQKPKYTKSKKMFEYYLDYDFETFKKLEGKALGSFIIEGITNNLPEELKTIKDFDFDSFKNDLIKFANNE